MVRRTTRITRTRQKDGHFAAPSEDKSTQTEGERSLQIVINKLDQRPNRSNPVEILNTPENYKDFANSIRSHKNANSSNIVNEEVPQLPIKRKRGRPIKAGPKCYKRKMMAKILEEHNEQDDLEVPIVLNENRELSVILEQPTNEAVVQEDATPPINLGIISIHSINQENNDGQLENSVLQEIGDRFVSLRNLRNTNTSPKSETDSNSEREENKQKSTRPAFFKIRADNVNIYNYFSNTN